MTLWTTMGPAGAVVAYRVIDHVSATPDRSFAVVAIVVLCLSFVPDIALLMFDPDATGGVVAVLMSMHVAATVCIAGLTDYVRGA